ncbi:ThiF family adenylyltransferase [Aureimonas ureilytica]|uniref:ThiF family adenylyltransferase n=1 Tax=Aureimonas ureilytica TaxID=401562 RepID=UPI00035F8C54|nr:ThiF family adenylyltransferase [Aureimonas ureilytica]
MWTPAGSVPVESKEVLIPLAKAFVAFIEAECSDFARLRACHRTTPPGVETVTFDLRIELPQRPVYAVHPTETVSVCFLADNRMAPFVAVGRQDFPDTPHQLLTREGLPSALCIDDRPWEDVRGDYSGSELMIRIVNWFEKACEGRLHGADQPFDPFFAYDNGYSVILRADAEAALAEGKDLTIGLAGVDSQCLVVASRGEAQEAHGAFVLSFVDVVIEPQRMTRMRRAPATLRQLADMLAKRGFDLIERLRRDARAWAGSLGEDRGRTWQVCVFVSMPQVHPLTGEIGASLPMVFLVPASLGDIGVALGVLTTNDTDDGKDASHLPLLVPIVSIDGSDAIPVFMVPVHRELDAERATQLAGRRDFDRRHLVMVGAGSLGSAVAEHLTREGQYRWTVIDDDTLLPHNMARHMLTLASCGRAKAPQLVGRLRSLRPDVGADAIVANVLHLGAEDPAAEAIDCADLVLDASASIAVSRWLSDREGDARRLCAFFTPDGLSCVLMAEAADRTQRLRDVEATYLREVLVNPALAHHHRPGQQMRHTGACRALTNTIPSSSVAVLAGLLAGALPGAASAPAASLRIWSRQPNGDITSVGMEASCVCLETQGWRITVPESLVRELASKRAEALPNETGGPLVGLADHVARHIAIVHALPSPPDSIGTPAGFERGTRGLRRSIEDARARSGGQVRYLGEWHSHPSGHCASPSSVDVRQIQQLSLALSIDGLPAISLIVGEGEMGLMFRTAA